MRAAHRRGGFRADLTGPDRATTAGVQRGPCAPPGLVGNRLLAELDRGVDPFERNEDGAAVAHRARLHDAEVLRPVVNQQQMGLRDGCKLERHRDGRELTPCGGVDRHPLVLLLRRRLHALQSPAERGRPQLLVEDRVRGIVVREHPIEQSVHRRLHVAAERRARLERVEQNNCSCSAPAWLSPTSSRRSRWRATNDTIGTGRSACCASTSFDSLEPSVEMKSTSAARVASHRMSSSRNSTTAS